MTPGAKRVLLELAEVEDRDVIVEGKEAYVGSRRTTVAIVNELLRLMALDRVDNSESHRYYTISSTGHALIQRPALEQELINRLTSRRRAPFTIINNRIRPLSALR